MLNNKSKMSKKNSCVLGTLLVTLAVCGVALAQGEGDRYVLDSLKMLQTVNTIECDLRIETFVDGREYTSRGRYEEQALSRTPPGQPPPFLRSMHRLEIYFSMNSSLASNAEPNRMTLVCRPGTDGEKSLAERYTIIEGDKSFSTIDLARLEQRIRTTNLEIPFTQVSEVRNLGGLLGMVRQISRFYECSLPTQENLQDEETIPALKLTGQLRSTHYENLLTQFGGLDKRGRSPADFPSDIEIWIGRHNDFPYKIRYLRRIAENSERKELLFQETFFNVVLNGTPIPASRFAPLALPEGVFSVQDDTDNFIGALGL